MAMRMTASERREQLLDVTRRLVTERGFAEVSMDAVARAAGVSRPVVYEHFGRLENLLGELVDRETGRALAQLTAALPRRTPGGDPRDDLLAALRVYLDAVASEPETWRLVLLPSEGAPHHLRAAIAAGRSWNLTRLTDLVAEGLAPGEGSPDPELTARMLSGTAEELARLHLTDAAGYPVERLVEHSRWVLSLVGQGMAGASR